MKWRNCELHNVDDAEAIRAIRKYCNMHNIPYETSDAGYNLTHFEIYCDDEIAKSFNAIIKGKAVYHYWKENKKWKKKILLFILPHLKKETM